MLENEEECSIYPDEDNELDSQIPIIIFLCQSGLGNLRLAAKRCKAATIIYLAHRAMICLNEGIKSNNVDEDIWNNQELWQKR